MHINLKHNIGSFVFGNIYPFILYGEAQPHLAYFEKEQDKNIRALNEFKGHWDIDEKCPITTCKVHAGNGDRLDEHINGRHKSYKKQIKIK
jgi:hypothetical protein